MPSQLLNVRAKARPLPAKLSFWTGISEVYGISLKEQPQILRLTTPKLRPNEPKSLFGDPEVRLGPRSLSDCICDANE